MYQNFVFYNINTKVSSKDIYQLGFQIFSALGLVIKSIGEIKMDNNLNLQLNEYNDKVNFEKNVLTIETNFRLNNLNRMDERLTFGYNSGKTELVSNINVCIALDQFNEHELKITKEILDRFHQYTYAISFKSQNIFDAFEYFHGQSFINLYPYEQSYLWEESLNNDYFQNGEFRKQIRLVYEDNYIEPTFFETMIDNQKLISIISQDENLGTINQLSSNLYYWKVEEEKLEMVNIFLGENGLLVSYDSSFLK